jgi:DNA-binding transcriptional LysR family regulator
MEALRAVARTGSFGRGAQELGYTQSAVSQQIAALERIVGEPVFTRPGGRRQIELTPAGELLLRHAEVILARVRAAQADVASLAEGAAGSLRVGTYQSVGAHILPVLLRRFADRWPGVDVHLHESPDDGALWGLLERGELDLSFTMLPIGDGPLEALEVLRDPYVLVAAADSPLARRRRPPDLAQVAALPLVAFRSCRNEHRIDAQLRARGLEPNIVFRSDDNGTVQGLVANGLGVALMPRMTVDANDPRTVVVELGEEVPPRSLGIAWHRDRRRTPAFDAFVSMAAEVCGEIAGPQARARPAAAAPSR